jgi:hypothetical protein
MLSLPLRGQQYFLFERKMEENCLGHKIASSTHKIAPAEQKITWPIAAQRATPVALVFNRDREAPLYQRQGLRPLAIHAIGSC